MKRTRLIAAVVSLALLLALVPATALAQDAQHDTVPVVGAGEEAPTVVEPTPSSEATAQSNDNEYEAASDVTSYSYQVQPLLAPFNNLVYVKTNNPDPTGFRLVDKSSKYMSPGDTTPAFSLYEGLFADVVYEDESTYRVKGGYIFNNYSCTSDGGTLYLQQKRGSSWSDTGVTVSCPAMEDDVDYLIDTYATGKSSLFDRLDAIQQGLNELAYYPAPLEDKSKPSSRPYPFLATSPYPELLLNEHYSMYQVADESLLTRALYPYILDSASFPGTMRTAARRLDPSCTITAGYTHPYIDVTSNGVTKTYGGAGSGDNDPIYTDRVTKDFTFTGGAGDFALNGSLTSIGNRYSQYQSTAVTDAETYKDQITGSQLASAIGSGSWIRVVREGSSRDDFAYIAYGFDGVSNTLSDAWVDGRYIDDHERFDPTATFSDHPTADVVLRNQSYTDYDGNKHQNDIVYQYDKSTDTWRAPYYYCNHWSYPTNITLPSKFILTRSQVESMASAGQIDGSSIHIPESFLIYDGSSYPGTPGTATHVAGISLPASYSAAPSSFFSVTATVTPADASYPTYITWDSDNTAVANVYGSPGTSTATVYTTSQLGTAHITATTWDGQYVASMTVTVNMSLEDAVVSDVPDQEPTGSALTPSLTVTLDGTQLTEGVDYQVTYTDNVDPGKATATITGIGSYGGTLTKSFYILDGARVERLSGAISDDTAAAIAAEAYEGEKSEYVVISRDDTYYDALSGAGLAGTFDAPILLTGTSELSGACRDAIESLGATHALILGGPNAVSEGVEGELADLLGGSEYVARVYGDDVYGTSMACTQALVSSGHGNSQYAIACNPTNFADAVSISGWAYRNKVPIMLQTWGGSAAERGYDAEATSVIAGRDLIVCGGEMAVSQDSVSGLGAKSVTRLGGDTLYDTSLAIANWELRHGMSASYVALASAITSYNGVDALAASALAGRSGGVVLLVQSNPNYEPYVETSGALNFIASPCDEIQQVFVLGGTVASTPALYEDVRAALAGKTF